MEYYFIYAIKVIALQTLLFSIYWFVSRKSVDFQFNRFFLLSILILPFFVPLLSIPVTIFQQDLNANNAFIPWIAIEQSLPNIVINESKSIMAFPWWMTLLIVIYLSIAIPSFLMLIFDYLKIHNLDNKSTKKEITPKGFGLYYVNEKILSFSFLNKIFISDLFPIKNHEKNTIITHEEYHLIQRHSLDILLVELIRILCWFNPIIILIQKNLKETHEFLADCHTVNQYGKTNYISMLNLAGRRFI